MICLIEPQCVSWQHEMVNSGFLNLVLDTFIDEKIVMACDEAHYKAITRRINDYELNRIVFNKINLDFELVDSIKGSEPYCRIIESCIIQNPEIDRLVLLSSHNGNINAVRMMAQKYHNIRFIIVVHAIMEKLIKRSGFRDFISVRKYATSLKELIIKTAQLDNVAFISYSPHLKDCTHSLFPQNVLRKFSFLHHPYVYESNTYDQVHNGIKVSVMGACNASANYIISNSLCHGDNCFVSMGGGVIQPDIVNENRIINIESGNRITREEINKVISETDYYLIPYNRKQYRISASGVLFDAINYRKPIIMMDSPLLRYYNERFDIGYFFTNPDDAAKFISKVFSKSERSDDYCMKVLNMEKAITVMSNENKEYIEVLLGV